MTIKARWQSHRNTYKNKNSEQYNKVLYKAFRQYGIENFKFEVIELCNPENLNEREIYWIDFYDSFKNGYNATPGGNEPIKTNKTELYRLWDEGYTVSEITEILGLNHNTVSKHLQGYKNYSQLLSAQRGGIKASKQIQRKQIIRYSLDGKEIDRWNSCKEIYRELGINNQAVMKNIKGQYRQAGGYRWAYEGEELKEVKLKCQDPEQNTNAKLNWDKVHQIKSLLKKGNSSKQELAKQFNVSVYTIADINSGKSWKEDDDSYIYPIYDFIRKKSNN